MDASAPSLAGAPMQSWLEKWSEWEIQAIVAFSFSMQVILFFMAGIRRYSISSVLKVLLWLVYLLADTAAIYALGHMSASLSSKTSTDKHQLVAFWAPFLLLHLGGQDNITAYALEDNELWLRHLLNMFVQVAGTGYVLYKYIIADRTTIVSAAMLVSVAGFVKYGERIWALGSAKKAFNRPNRSLPPSILHAKNCFTRNIFFRNYEFTVLIAHWYPSDFVKRLIIDRDEDPTFFVSAILKQITRHVDGLVDRGDVLTREKRYAEEVYRAIEVQLALAYDMLYTKAQVFYTWYGYLIRGISIGFCFGALVAFTKSKRDGYCTPDIVITFVLLGGACALEVASAFKLIGSTWTYAILKDYGWTWLANPILFTRYQLAKDGKWSNSVGRYDFISLCGSDKTRLKRKMVGLIGVEDWWNKAHYTKHAKLSPALKEFVWGLLRGEKSGMVQIEDVAIRSGYWARRLTGFNQSEELDWSLRLEFHHCVFIWHITTSIFLDNPAVKSELVHMGMAEEVNILSDYMMYLLFQHPDILPTSLAARNLFRKTYDCYQDLYRYHSTDDVVLDRPHKIIMDRRGMAIDECEPTLAMLVKASNLVWTFLSMKLELTHKMVIMGRVWTEMLSYAATNASGDFHARQLSNGGEFLTHMLLLTTYCSGMPPVVQDRYRAVDDQPVVEVVVPVEPTMDVVVTSS